MCVQIIAASPVPKGQEVHNTYGELGNAELVVKYGFALRQNPFEAVLLEKGALAEEARRIVGDRACRQRCRFLSRERWGAGRSLFSASLSWQQQWKLLYLITCGSQHACSLMTTAICTIFVTLP